MNKECLYLRTFVMIYIVNVILNSYKKDSDL